MDTVNSTLIHNQYALTHLCLLGMSPFYVGNQINGKLHAAKGALDLKCKIQILDVSFTSWREVLNLPRRVSAYRKG